MENLRSLYGEILDPNTTGHELPNCEEIESLKKQMAILEAQTKTYSICKLDPRLSMVWPCPVRPTALANSKKTWAADLRKKP